MNPTEKRHGAQYILYDADLLKEADPNLFDVRHLAQAGALRGTAEGRGATHFFELDGRQFVLRHYRRGGRMAALLEDRYLRTALHRTRSWREWRLLARLAELNLPAPRPAAARVTLGGAFYRADLITLRIENSQPLAQRLQNSPLSRRDWYAAGSCIRRFHTHGVYHADLNAHNILLDSAGEFHLIDFDKGMIRTDDSNWQQANLSRLRRSLEKLSRHHPTFFFDDESWHSLLAGWHE